MKTESLELILAALDRGFTPAEHVIEDAAKELTALQIEAYKRKPISTAYRVTLSPHEWEWTQEEQVELARDVLRGQSKIQELRLAIKALRETLETCGLTQKALAALKQLTET